MKALMLIFWNIYPSGHAEEEAYGSTFIARINDWPFGSVRTGRNHFIRTRSPACGIRVNFSTAHGAAL